ncbi:hypothetical protein AAC387_Pa02g1198 [Persea americana]
MEMDGEETNRRRDDGVTAVFRGTEYSSLHASVALALWPGAIFLTPSLILTALFFFPSRLSLSILGLLVFLMVIPLNDKNKWGQELARYICKYFRGYFPVAVHVEDIKAFDPNQAYVFGYEPHSILAIVVVALVNFTGFMPLPKIKVLGCSAVAFLKARKGFVRIAMGMGRPLVPVFCYGQRNVYKWWKPSGKLVAKIPRIIKFPPIIFWGIFGSPIPYRHPMHIVVGRPIELKKNPLATAEEVDEVHKQFVAALVKLYEMHKATFGYNDVQSKIV